MKGRQMLNEETSNQTQSAKASQIQAIKKFNDNIQKSSTQKTGDSTSPQEKPERPKMKKLNFHVIVKDTKLYHALKFIEAFKRAQNSRELKKADAEGDSKGPMSIYHMSSEMSQCHNLHDLSSFILTRDCSILKFALYCFHVGIVNSVQ